VFKGLVDGHGGGDLDDGEPEFWSAFPAIGDAPPVTQPAVGAFDRPAFASERVARSGTATVRAAHGRCAGRDGLSRPAALADHRFDPALAQLAAQLGAVVAAVCPELGRREATREQLVDQRQKVQPLVLVAGADPDRERCAGGVDC
jgi:hypothetical protein